MELEKQIFLETKEFKFEYEIVGDVLVLHLNVTRWSHNVYKLMKGVFDLFIADAKAQGYRKLVTFTPNTPFVKLFGGEVVDHMIVNNQYIEAIVWELKQP